MYYIEGYAKTWLGVKRGWQVIVLFIDEFKNIDN